jgi:hypothetical protein
MEARVVRDLVEHVRLFVYNDAYSMYDVSSEILYTEFRHIEH